jgi:hypothetical protein
VTGGWGGRVKKAETGGGAGGGATDLGTMQYYSTRGRVGAREGEGRGTRRVQLVRGRDETCPVSTGGEGEGAHDVVVELDVRAVEPEGEVDVRRRAVPGRLRARAARGAAVTSRERCASDLYGGRERCASDLYGGCSPRGRSSRRTARPTAPPRALQTPPRAPAPRAAPLSARGARGAPRRSDGGWSNGAGQNGRGWSNRGPGRALRKKAPPLRYAKPASIPKASSRKVSCTRDAM